MRYERLVAISSTDNPRDVSGTMLLEKEMVRLPYSKGVSLLQAITPKRQHITRNTTSRLCFFIMAPFWYLDKEFCIAMQTQWLRKNTLKRPTDYLRCQNLSIFGFIIFLVILYVNEKACMSNPNY